MTDANYGKPQPEGDIYEGWEEVAPQVHQIPIVIPRRHPITAGSRRRHGKPPLALRIPLQLMSLVLCLALTVGLLATALLVDTHRALSAGGIQAIVSALLTTSRSPARPTPQAAPSGRYAHALSETTTEQIPTGLIAGGDSEALVEWILDMLEQSAGTQVDVDREILAEFVEKSTLSEYLADKMAGYTADFINGTQNTQITSQELMALLEENEALIAETFQISLDLQTKQQLQQALEKTIEENRLNEVIHDEVFDSVRSALDQALPIQWEQLQALLQALTSRSVMGAAIGLCLGLMLLLLALNFYDLAGGLTWSAVSCLLSGVLLSVPIAMLQAMPQALTDMAGVPPLVAQCIVSLAGATALVHYGILAIGIVLLLISLVWRILRASSRPAAAF